MSLANSNNLLGFILIDIRNVIDISCSRLENVVSLDVGLSDDILGVSLLNGLGVREGLSLRNLVARLDSIEALRNLRDDRLGLSVGSCIILVR